MMYDLLSSLPESAEAQPTGEPMVVTENQDGTYVKGLTSHLAQNEEEALNLLFEVLYCEEYVTDFLADQTMSLTL